jgi:hypothetical protein
MTYMPKPQDLKIEHQIALPMPVPKRAPRRSSRRWLLALGVAALLAGVATYGR